MAVQCDYERAKTRHQGRYEPEFGFLTSLYALKHTPFQEIIPDNSRYGIICSASSHGGLPEPQDEDRAADGTADGKRCPAVV